MKITQDQVKHVAKLASLQLSSEELAQLTKQLGETISYVEQLDEVDTDGMDSTSQVTGLKNITREDEIGISLTQDEALQNTGSSVKGYFKVPAVLEDI